MDQVEEVKRKTDIVTVVGEYVQLSKAGRNFKGVCPFHQERTPSFVVSPELQIYKCFGCGESGDAISFIEKLEGLDFYDVLKLLAAKVGVKLTAPKGQNLSEKDRLYEANDLAAKFYHYILTKHPMGKSALDYVTKVRGLSAETIKTFNLGFSPDIPDAAVKFLTKKKGFTLLELEKAGLAVQGRKMAFDRFRGRIIFPLNDIRGVCIGLAGRILPEIEARLPKDKHLGKYINSPETAIYHKSKNLYGLNITKKDIKKENKAVIVEGEVDFLSLWQNGIKNVVAIKGTALTEEQIQILARFTDTFILALDSDIAGDMAARRGIVLAQNQGVKVRVLKPHPKYKDPDDYVRADALGFKKALDKSESVWDFLIDSVFSRYDATTGEGKAEISRELMPTLALIEDNIVQSYYVSQVAKKLEVSVEAVNQQVGKLTKPHPEKENTNQKVEEPDKQTRQDMLEYRLIALAFRSEPKLLLTNQQFLKTNFSQKILASLQTEQSHQVKDFTTKLPAEVQAKFAELLLAADDEFETAEQIEKEKDLVLKELKSLSLKGQLANLRSQISQLEKADDDEQVAELTKEFTELSSQLAQLE